MATKTMRDVVVGATQPGLRFDPAAHAYFLYHDQLPSVTKLTGNLYNGPRASPERLAETANRGSEIHHLTEVDDAADPIGEDVPGWLMAKSQHAGERNAWRDWRRTRKFEPERIECRMASSKWRVAGTVDRIGTFHRPDPVPAWWKWGREISGIVDIKTGAIPDMCGAQMAAYRHMAYELGFVEPDCPLVAVAIRESGAWWDQWYCGSGPDALWQAAWSIWYLRPDNHRHPPDESKDYTYMRAAS